MGNECRMCSNNSMPKSNNLEKNKRVILCITLPENEDNRWFVHMNKQCRILSNTQCIWSSEILKKLKSLKSRFKRESNLKNIADINRNFLKIHDKNSEILCSSEHIDKLKGQNSSHEEDNSFLSNFLEYITIDNKNEQKYKDSLLMSYETTKFSDFSIVKEKNNDKYSFGPTSSNFNDGFAYYKLVTSCIRRHLNEIDDNELAYLINEFVNIFEIKSLKVINKFKRSDTTVKEFEVSKQDLIRGLQQFIRVLQESLVLYYNLNDSGNRIPQSCLFTKDNLLNLVISILLDNEKIYDKIFELEILSENKSEECYRTNCDLLQNLLPQDFSIAVPYCLNSKTTRFFKNQNKKENEEKALKNNKNIENQLDKKSFEDSKGESNSPLRPLSIKEKNKKPMTKPIGQSKKYSCNNEEIEKKELNESTGKILERTFYSASSYDIKNNPIRNNNFNLPERKNSESFLSIKANNNNNLSETNNNFVSFNNSMENINSNNNELSHYHSISMLQENSDQNKNKILEFDQNNLVKDFPFSDKNILKKISFNIEKISTETTSDIITSNPYEKGIKIMKSLYSFRKPLQKLEKILEISESIKISIKDFYNENNLKHVKNKQIDGDDVLAILLYMVIKSSLKHFRIHLKIIENFTTENILNSKNGYYLMMMQLCLKFVDNLNPDDLKAKNEENKKIFIYERVKDWIREKRINKMMIIGSGKLRK